MMPTKVEIARAERVARLAVRAGLPLSANPYPKDRRVERYRWDMAHAAATALLADEPAA